MDRTAIWKWLILFVVITGSLALVMPPKDKIRLGLDLQGGTSFTVKIDEQRLREDIQAREPGLTTEELDAATRKAMDGAQPRALEVLRNRIDNLGIAEPVIYPGKENTIIIQLPGIDEEKRKEAERSIRSAAFLEFRLVHEKNADLAEDLFAKNKAPEGYTIVQVGGASMYRRDRTALPDSAIDKAYRERLSRFGVPNAAYEFMLEREEKDNQVLYRPVFVDRRRTQLTGEFLKSAGVDYRALGQPVVSLEFDAKGAKYFSRVTSDYAPGGARNPDPTKYRQLAVVLDNTLYSAPVIREPIHGGKAEISGSFTLREAQLLSGILRAGALPAPVDVIEKRFVSPSLGADTIRSGVRAALAGSIGVILFMALYYRLAGFVANVALILNMVLLPLAAVATAGFLSIFVREGGSGASVRLPVLTMPGIAGIALTIGMAVDANVLIYERVREELNSGKRIWSAILAGYDRAFITILDSNLTTVLTGLILFIFGSGPIRGFSVTLCAGIIASMYTSIMVTKMLLSLFVERGNVQTLKMGQIIGKTAIDFISKQKIAALFSVVVIVGSLAIMFVRGQKDPATVFGVDFTGGSAMTYSFTEKVPVESVRTALQAANIPDVSIQYQQSMDNPDKTFLEVKTSADKIKETDAADVVSQALTDAFPKAGIQSLQVEKVGPQVGSELKRKTVWAMVLALVMMIVYITVRFEFGFALGAIVALAHDTLFTLGVFSLCGRQVNLTVVAALMTIIGYSVNDTIVIFDRIRENLRSVRQGSFKDICNLSINATLSRTILTSGTVFITVLALLLLGGGSIFDFALTMFIGVLVGTYSTVYIATPVVLLWHRNKRPDLGGVTKAS